MAKTATNGGPPRNTSTGGYLAVIKELEADLEQSERVVEARLDVIEAQAIQIKTLERDSIRLASKIRELEVQCEDLMQNCNSLRERAWKAEAEATKLVPRDD